MEGIHVEELYVKARCVRVNELRVKELCVTRVSSGLRAKELHAKELHGKGPLTCSQRTVPTPWDLVIGKRWFGAMNSATGAQRMQVLASLHVASKHRQNEAGLVPGSNAARG